MSSKVGILMQGVISDWTEKIVREYQSNFPDASILVSTWTTENTERIPCEIIKVEPPQQTQPYQSNVNHQKVGTLAGLERMSCDLVMKTRTDQFVHNKDIFKIYEEICNKEKIMIPNYATIETMDYFASDFCQIATKDVLVNYWNSIKEYDGTFLISHAEIYLTENYVLREKKRYKTLERVSSRLFLCSKLSQRFSDRVEKIAK